MAFWIYIVLSIVGGWFWWRRNPMYSAGKTVQVIFLFGGTIAIVTTVLIVLMLWMMGKPTAITITALIVCFVAGMTLIVDVSIRVFNPPPAALPGGTKLATVNRRKIIPWLKALALIVAALGVVALFLSPDNREILGIFAAILAGFSAFVLMVVYLARLRLDRALTAVLTEPWVHWTYTRPQWEAWTEQQVARMEVSKKKMTFRSSVIVAVVLTALMGVPLMFTAASTTTGRLSILALAAVTATVSTVAISWSRGRELANYRKQLLAAEPEAFFAPDGLFVEGEYCAWISAEIYLLSASIEPTTPPCVSMLFERVRSDAVVGIDTFRVKKRVMIPAGADDDLAKLQKNLAATCHKARVSLV